MASRHEAIALALIAVLEPLDVHVTRTLELPRNCPKPGLANVVLGDPEEVDYQLGVNIREWARGFSIEVIVQHHDADARLALLDDVLVAIGDRLLEETLGGLIDHLEVGPPVSAETIPMEGAASLCGAVIEVTLFYETSKNTMEIQS
ncbi:hypothetical protein J7426_14325 [Tropicibacter sp. R16_0]|uniref:hypothetical protein n=1 Tax=Tropicibacter sp. R16_0 TaxID=2821102 RepID=UPI001ADB9F78|nr:hypothetical protein [Tropicibacter sp. R16_0]MBO9451446.1 hypothetical protein [Tropicibacter sp. R16_0]